MQTGEAIWLLAGIGIGLTAAILIFWAIAFADERRLRRGAPAAEEPVPAVRTTNRPPPRHAPAEALRSPIEPRRPLSPSPAARPAEAASAKTAEPPAEIIVGMVSDLAAEIARVQTSASEPSKVELPAPQPVRVAAEATAAPAQAAGQTPEPTLEEPVLPIPPAAPQRTGIAPETAIDTAPQPVTPEPISAPDGPLPTAPPPPKVPPLPKVTPARKFAPALPPRNTPVDKS